MHRMQMFTLIYRGKKRICSCKGGSVFQSGRAAEDGSRRIRKCSDTEPAEIYPGQPEVINDQK